MGRACKTKDEPIMIVQYFSRSHCCKELGVSPHKLRSGVEARAIRTRTAKGQTRAKYHLEDCRTWVEKHPPKVQASRDHLTGADITYQEAAQILGLGIPSVRQYVARDRFALTRESVMAYKPLHEARKGHLVDPDQGLRKKASGPALAAQTRKLEAQADNAEALAAMNQRKNEVQAGEVCYRSELHKVGARVALAVVQAEQPLGTRIPIAFARYLTAHVPDTETVMKLEAALRKVVADCVQEARETLCTTVRDLGESEASAKQVRALADYWMETL